MHKTPFQHFAPSKEYTDAVMQLDKVLDGYLGIPKIVTLLWVKAGTETGF